MKSIQQVVSTAAGQTPTGLITTSMQLTPPDPDQFHRRAGAALAEAVQLACRLLSEISMRWPGQTSWAKDPEVARAWGRAMAEQPHRLSWPELAQALGQLSNRPYPPSIGALIATIAPTAKISLEEARRALRLVDRVSASGSWWKLPPEVWQALQHLDGGIARVRQREDEGRGAREFLRAWLAAMEASLTHPDPSVRAGQPPRPAALLGPSDAERARRAAVAAMHEDQICDALGISRPNRRGSSDGEA